MSNYKKIPWLIHLVILLIPIALSAQDQDTMAQNRAATGFDPYVFITISPEVSLATNAVTEINVDMPFYIGIQLPPLLARNKDFSTDYAIDISVFRPDGKELLHKDKYHASKEMILEKSVFRFIKPMMMLSFDQNQTKGNYRIQVVLHDFVAARTRTSSCTVVLK
jgi:hypothetical protein